jgi:hypothetical protein
MAKKTKKTVKKSRKVIKQVEEPKKKIVLWRWIIVSIPLIVGVMWAISILSVHNELPIIYEQTSPGDINTLLGLIFTFIVSYGAFVFIQFKKTTEEI